MRASWSLRLQFESAWGYFINQNEWQVLFDANRVASRISSDAAELVPRVFARAGAMSYLVRYQDPNLFPRATGCSYR